MVATDSERLIKDETVVQLKYMDLKLKLEHLSILVAPRLHLLLKCCFGPLRPKNVSAYRISGRIQPTRRLPLSQSS